MTDTSVSLSWSALPGRTYRVQYSSDLGSIHWTSLGLDITAAGSTASTTDSRTPTNRFYRVQLLRYAAGLARLSERDFQAGVRPGSERPK